MTGKAEIEAKNRFIDLMLNSKPQVEWEQLEREGLFVCLAYVYLISKVTLTYQVLKGPKYTQIFLAPTPFKINEAFLYEYKYTPINSFVSDLCSSFDL